MSIDLSLDRVTKLLVRLPSYTRPTLHIAGTNGKGSVSALLTSILLGADPPLRVGRFNSPHLISISDCITIDNVPVLSSLYETVRAEVERADKEHQAGLTNFEILTLVALQIFEKCRMDVVVLEVGMGGRLDATNVVSDEAIAVSALTAIDMDHQAFLGDTITKIAREKAGIGRAGRPFVLGKQKHAEVDQVVKDVLSRLGSRKPVDAIQVRTREWNEAVDGVRPPPFSLGSPFQQPASQPISAELPCFPEPVDALFPLYGKHQLDNLGTSLTIINELLDSPALQEVSSSLRLKERINAKSVATGIQNVRWPGRLSFHTLRPAVDEPSSAITTDPLVVLVDGAHNPASAATLGDYITHLFGLALECPSSASKPTSVEITYIIALTHSPPKTPLETLSAILPPKIPNSTISVKTRVILLRFTPPDGMPWVRPVVPEDMEEVVRRLVPDVQLLVEADFGPPMEGGNVALENALKWVYRRRLEKTSAMEGGKVELVVLAGSLYLVADFYRLLQSSNGF